ncbi:nitroreductase family protein [Candidatus Saccharibacteria bacterium]|nr:nitroreductase family protein [Candidatus Saccharibacteria bacterium]
MIKQKIIKTLLGLNDFQVEKFKLMVKESKMPLFVAPNSELDALLLSHSIEKGMSLDNPKEVFGEDKALLLLELLSKMEGVCFEYNVSMSILEEYIKSRGYESEKLNNIKSVYKKLKKEKPYKKIPAGIDYISRSEMMRKTQMDLFGFLSSRHDIRKTTDERIKKNEIQKAVTLASLAPSACNRQPWKVYYSMEKEKNIKLGEIVSGNKTFAQDMRYYCAIVLDYRFFANRLDEFRQIYLNAGIFIAYFVLALHFLGIGSCIMQFTGLVEDADKKSRELLNLKKSEQVMVVIGYGKYPEKIKYSKAGRRSADEIMVEF